MKSFKSGLTYQQENDCYKAGRSPRSGRYFPTATPTAAQRSAREMNWRKLLIVGAIGQLRHVARLVGVNSTLINDLNSIESTLLEASINKHEATKRFKASSKEQH